MAEMNLGGSRYANLHEAITGSSPQTIRPYEYRPKLVQWPLSEDMTVAAIVDAMVPSGGGRALTPIIVDNAGNIVAVGETVTSASTPVDAEGFYQQSIEVSRPGDGESRVYELKFILENCAVADDVRGFGGLRTEY